MEADRTGATTSRDANKPQRARRSRREVIAGLALGGGAVVAGTVGWIGSSKGAGTPFAGFASPAAASPAASPATGDQIVISNFAFSPASLTVPAGRDVIWMNQDDIPHTVTSADKTSFASALLDTGDQFRHRFTTVGTYPYFCALHPFMTGRIIVH